MRIEKIIGPENNEFPTEIQPRAASIHYTLGKELNLIGVRKLLSVDEKSATLLLGKWLFCIEGTHISVTLLEDGVCCVSGHLQAFSFSNLRKGERP